MAFNTECLPVAPSLLGMVRLAISIPFVLVLMVIDGNMPTWHPSAVIPRAVPTFAFIPSLGA
jgi:lipopolysaccharide transport system permease protein